MPKEQWVIKSLTPRKIILIINRDTGIKMPLSPFEFILEPIDAEYIVYTRWDYTAKTLHYKTKIPREESIQHGIYPGAIVPKKR
jgi:hypothetical protein